MLFIIVTAWGAAVGLLTYILGPPEKTKRFEYPTYRHLQVHSPKPAPESWVPPLLQAARQEHLDAPVILPGLERRNQETPFAYSTRLHKHLGSALRFAEMDDLVKRMIP